MIDNHGLTQLYDKLWVNHDGFDLLDLFDFDF